MSMARKKIAILWRGDAAARRDATPANNRFFRVFEELTAVGIEAVPAVYADDIVDEIRAELLAADGVLVWVDPIHQGLTREKLDPLLREVAARGPWVSAHPDTILKMGTKEILVQTRHLGWGTDTHLYRTEADFRAAFPPRLAAEGPRVLKQHRGNGGRGVWKVEALPGGQVLVLHAALGSVPEVMALDAFMARCAGYFAGAGRMIDQPFQPRLPEGMIRCYVGVDKVVGFGHQLIKALIPPPPEGPDSPQAQPGPRIFHAAEAPQFRALRAKMDGEWIPQMMRVLGLDRRAMPIIWDADFLYGPRDAAGADSYVLCEINVSSVFAIPEQAPAAIARLVMERCGMG